MSGANPQNWVDWSVLADDHRARIAGCLREIAIDADVGNVLGFAMVLVAVDQGGESASAQILCDTGKGGPVTVALIEGIRQLSQKMQEVIQGGAVCEGDELGDDNLPQ